MTRDRKIFRLDRPGYDRFDGYPLRVILESGYDKKHFELGESELKPLDEGSFITPMMILQKDELTELMNEMWRCGIRPDDDSNAPASVEAIKYHLEDMRKLVFKDSIG